MTDPRITELAELLINYSVKLGKGEHLLIETFDCPDEIAIECVQSVIEGLRMFGDGLRGMAEAFTQTEQDTDAAFRAFEG